MSFLLQGPFNYIPEYRNPCWWAGTAANNITYTKVNDHKQTTYNNKAIRDGKYLARHMPVLGNVHPIKIENVVISLLAGVVILLIDTATQEVPMKNI